MIKRKLTKKEAWRIASNIIYPVISLCLVLAVWAIVAAVKNNPLLLPAPTVVIQRFFTLGTEASFWTNVGWTLLRTLGCFLLSFVLALVLAALSGLFKPLNRILSPIVMFLRSAPTVAVILIMYAFMGTESLTVAVGFLIAFPLMYSAFFSAIEGVDKDLLEMSKIYKVRGVDKVMSIYLPSITPTLFDNSRATLSLTLKVVVAAEILTLVPKSIGNSIQTASASFEIAYLLAWTLVAIVFSFVLEIIVVLIKKLWEVSR